MECNVIKDLLPLYIDGCCSLESTDLVTKHMEQCDSCKRTHADMKLYATDIPVPNQAIKVSKIREWKASLLQSLLLIISFSMIIVGVTSESITPVGSSNGLWAIMLIVPATGLLLSLTNWYFIRLYKSRKKFSSFSSLLTFIFSVCGYGWSLFHYGTDMLQRPTVFHGIGILLTAAFCILVKLLSNAYASMLGKE